MSAELEEIRYRDGSGREVTEKIDPQTLDEKMNHAAYLSHGPGDKPEETPTGTRGG